MFSVICNLLRLKTQSVSGTLSMRQLTTLFCAALVTMNIGCCQDSAQWKVAAAINEAKHGNEEEAIELLQAALRMDPDSSDIKLRLAGLLAENDQGDLGVTLCDEVLESDPAADDVWKTRSSCLLLLGRFDEALADYQKHVIGSIDKNSEQLNQLAYQRALAGSELDKALRQINQGIGKLEQQQFWGRFSSVPIEVSSIVSAGLISRYTDGGQALIMDLLNELIFEEQRVWLDQNAKFQRLLTKFEKEDRESQSGDTDERRAKRQKAEEDQAYQRLQLVAGNLTVSLATRSLIFEDQGQSELADLDRLWLKRIGYEPSEIYKALPSDIECLAALHNGGAMLDTRGFILTQMPWLPTWTIPTGAVFPMTNKNTSTSYGSYKGAMRDFDIAVAAAEIRLLALNSTLANRIEFPAEHVQPLKMMEARMIAVLRNHRRQALLKAKQLDAAQQDLLRIKELGYEAGPSLF